MNTTNPGNRPLSLAGHMRSLASLLQKNHVHYNWNQCSECNCGLLARSVLGLTQGGLSHLFKEINPKSTPMTWQQMASIGCKITGEPMSEVFRRLEKEGMLFGDFSDLEYLQNPIVLARALMSAGWRRFWFENKKPISLALYLNAWATLIEEHHAANPAVPTEAQLEAVETRPLVNTEK